MLALLKLELELLALRNFPPNRYNLHDISLIIIGITTARLEPDIGAILMAVAVSYSRNNARAAALLH
ncbi:hypothetical protein D3C76_954050 [compost metagenome]